MGDHDDPEVISLRRRMDRVQEERMTKISDAIDRLQTAFAETLKEAAKITTTQAAMMERQTAFNQAFLEHDEREGKERERIIATLERINENLHQQGEQIKIHAEAISTLKQWTWYLAAAVGALASSGVAWIIQHLQATR